MKEKYCYKCGKELVSDSVSGFNTETGEQDKTICPTDECNHSGRLHKFKDFRKLGIFGWLKCMKCGFEESNSIWFEK